MKNTHFAGTLILVAVCLWLEGCAVVLVGAAAAGATAGTVSYYGNELQTYQEVPLDKAWAAAQTVANELQFKGDPNQTRKDGIKGVLVCRNAEQQQVVIKVLRQSEKLTEIRIRVGVFDTSANRHAAQMIYEKMRARM